MSPTQHLDIPDVETVHASYVSGLRLWHPVAGDVVPVDGRCEPGTLYQPSVRVHSPAHPNLAPGLVDLDRLGVSPELEVAMTRSRRVVKHLFIGVVVCYSDITTRILQESVALAGRGLDYLACLRQAAALIHATPVQAIKALRIADFLEVDKLDQTPRQLAAAFRLAAATSADAVAKNGAVAQ